MQIIHEISIDFQRVGIRPRIHVKENDLATRFVHVAFYNDGTPYAVTTSTTTALMCYAKPDGTSGVYDHIGEGEEEHQAYHFDSGGNGVTIELAPSMMIGFGLLCCEVRLVQAGDILGTFTFDVDVERSVTTGTKADDYFSYRALDALYAAIDSATENAAAAVADVAELRTDVADVTDRADAMEFDIRNLKAAAEGQLYREEVKTLDGVGYFVPVDALPGAMLGRIYGRTIVYNQLNNNSYGSTTNAGVTYTNNGDGTWTTSGTATGSSIRNTISTGRVDGSVGHKYLLRGCPAGGSNTKYRLLAVIGDTTYSQLGEADTGSGVIVTSRSSGTVQVRMQVLSGTDATGLTWRPEIIDLTTWFGAGNEPATVAECSSRGIPYVAPFSAGVQLHAAVTRIDSVGTTSKTIPAAVLALEHYGAAGTYIDYAAKTFYNGIESIDISGIVPDDFDKINVVAGAQLLIRTQNDFNVDVPVNFTISTLIKIGG